MKLLHMMHLSNTEASYPNTEHTQRRANDGKGLGVAVTSCQTFLSPKQCLSQCAGVCRLRAWLAHGHAAGVHKGLCFPLFPLLLTSCGLKPKMSSSQTLWEEEFAEHSKGI